MLAAHNAEYEAVHTVAYGISAEEQNDEQILRAYANTLCNYAATKLNRNHQERFSHQNPKRCHGRSQNT